MSNSTSHTHVDPTAPSVWVEAISQVGNSGVADSTRVVDIKIDRGVSSGSVTGYKFCYADTRDARRLCVMFLNGAKAFMFDLGNVPIPISLCGHGNGQCCGDSATVL